MLRTKTVTQATIKTIDIKTLELSEQGNTVTFFKVLTDNDLLEVINKTKFKKDNGFKSSDILKPVDIIRVKGVYEIEDEKFFELAELKEEFEIDEKGERIEEVESETEEVVSNE